MPNERGKKRILKEKNIPSKKVKLKSTVIDYVSSEDENYIKPPTINKSKSFIHSSQPILGNNLKKKLHTLLANWKPPIKKDAIKKDTSDYETRQTEAQNGNPINISSDESENTTEKHNIASLNKSEHSSHRILLENDFPLLPNQEILKEIDIERAEKIIMDSNRTSGNVQMKDNLIDIDPKDAIQVNEINGKPHENKENSKRLEDLSLQKINENIILRGIEQNNTSATDVPTQSTNRPTPETTSKTSSKSETEPIYSSKTITFLDDIPLQKEKDHTDENTKPNLHTEETDKNDTEESLKDSVQQPKLIEKNMIDIAPKSEKSMESSAMVNSNEDIQHNKSYITEHKSEDDEFCISDSQLNIIENISTATTTKIKTIQQPPKFTSAYYCDLNSNIFSPTMPQTQWTEQLHEDKKRLQTVVREISQLNAMLTRAIREVWPFKKSA